MKNPFLCLLLGVFALSSAYAALPPRDPENLDQAATLIVVAVAKDIAKSTRGFGLSVDSISTVEAEIESVSKGDAEAGGTIKIRLWAPKRRPAGWAGPQGVGPVPAKGDRFKAWLRKGEDGVWEALEPNGISIEPGSSASSEEAEPPKPKKRGFFSRFFGRN